MSRWHSYLNSATAILHDYHGEEPFSNFIKKYFSQHKKFGGQDRKWVSHLCYCYFRLGKAALQMPIEDRILLAVCLCSTESNSFLASLKPELDQSVSLSLEEKIKQSEHIFSPGDVFPWQEELSVGIEMGSFIKSFFIQPALFIRLRPGKEKPVRNKLEKAGIDFREIREDCLSLENSTKLDGIIQPDSEAVIQDYSSQRSGDLLQPLRSRVKTVWDCCAASGGKSIMAKDVLGDIQLTVSDVRSSIISNLEKRFSAAGIHRYSADVIDLEKGSRKDNEIFDLVIADVPCTGSGTWGRTPEQLYFFEKEKIQPYATRQRKILEHVTGNVKPGGYLLYCTCSVFKKENEEQVQFLHEAGWNILEQEILLGYNMRADTLFAALLQKPL